MCTSNCISNQFLQDTRKETHCEPHLNFPAISFCTWGATTRVAPSANSAAMFCRDFTWEMALGARHMRYRNNFAMSSLAFIPCITSLCRSLYHFHSVSFSVILSLYSSLYHFHSVIHFTFCFHTLIPLFTFSCHSLNNYHSVIPVSLSRHSLYHFFTLVLGIIFTLSFPS